MAEAIKLDIDPEAINRYVAERIIESTLGAQVRAVIDATVKSLMNGYNNPIEPAIKAAVATIIRDTIETDYRPQLVAAVRAKIAEAGEVMINKLIADTMAKLERGY